jgi:putative DNA primase/helicase
MRCHCEKDYKQTQRTARMRLQYDREQALADEKSMRDWALGLVEKSSTLRSGDVVDRYLRGRGLKPSSIFWPTQLRRARLYHSETKKSYDGMIAIVQNVAGDTVACHRTFVFEVGGRVVKASDRAVPAASRVQNARLSAASVAGHAVRLGVDADEIGVCEGIESALGLAMHTGLVCWAAISSSGMQELRVPRNVRRIVIGPDIGDLGGRDGRGKDVGMKAAHALRNRIVEEGKKRGQLIDVRILCPPIGKSDWGEQ